MPEVTYGGLDHSLNCQYIGNIYGIRKSMPAKPLFYFLGGTLSCLRVVLGYHYIGAFLS
jgi:hypothetical protein